MGVTGALIAAQATMAAASAYSQHQAAGAQAETSRAEATITHAQQEFEIARKAAVESEEYRRNLATTVATASARGGAGLARQFGGQAQSSFARDIEALNRAYKINDIQKQNKLAQAAALKSSSTFGAITGLAKDVLGAAAISGLGAKIPGTKSPIVPSATGLGTIPSLPKFKPNVGFAPDANYAGTKSGLFDPLG